ncbi:MoxR family ATPase [Wenzhouxiangella sp. XN79A]|uniref:AAA family ATPase n=1 Tax=Wenzhouxiangella sp. XN79A TaxID=2724193 RepID=UPI001F100308|nr:MoxR family ATPase [Wenzhouxiangella sp. XN79A]
MTEPSTLSGMAASPLERLQAAVDAVNGVVLGKPGAVRLAFSALLAGGHLLIEDLPGVGKTTLAQAMAIVTGGSWHRIQFTSDLLPADILGVSVWRRIDETFEFRPGPVFANVVLADEINRATPRTQSALLEAMAERQVSVDGVTHTLPRPFFVIATQNPLDLVGTYPLPDSQLDRFLLRISLGYPDADEERQLLREPDRRDLLADLAAVFDEDGIRALMDQASEVHLSDPVLDYLQALVAATREHPALRAGLSPRATLALAATARGHALLDGRDHVVPDDVKQIFAPLAVHRLQSRADADPPDDVVELILQRTPIS